MDMDTEAMRWFQQVVDGVTVTEVADIYRVSQPGVSRALARLEDQVGTPLLHRRGRVLRPTRAGVVFKGHLDTVLHGLDDALAAVDQLADPEAGTVVVAFQLSLGTWLVPRTIAQFREAHPRVQFQLRPSRDELGSSFVAGGRVDLEFTARRPRNPDVSWECLFAQPLVLAVPLGHRLSGRSEVGMAELADEEFVMLRPGWELRSVCDELCALAGFDPKVAFEGDDLPVVRGFVAAGLGVAIVPDAADEELVGQSASDRVMDLVRITDPGAQREVGLAWSKSRRLLPSAELFRRHVLAGDESRRPPSG